MTLVVAPCDNVTRRALAFFCGQAQGLVRLGQVADPHIEVLETLAGNDRPGRMSIREAANRVGRDVKAAHGDVQALLNAGVIVHIGEGILFPYDAMHVDFMLTKAA